MKKIIVLLLLIAFFTGCGKATKEEINSSTNYSGKETNLAKQFLSKGYLVNVYRYSEPLGDDAENYGKAYVTMTFSVLVETLAITDFNDQNSYIKKRAVTNIRLLKTPKMGTATSIYPNYTSYENSEEMKGSKNYFIEEFKEPVYYSGQTSVAVKVDRIALLDSSNYGWNEQPTISQIYNDLGITRDQVALTIAFRIELTTVSGKVLYKDYEVEMPPTGFDIGGSEFQKDFMTYDQAKMETFLEKE